MERGDIARSLDLPCGRCVGCRLERSRQWATRLVHENSLHSSSCFVTLTYAQEKLLSPSLEYSDFQNFLKSLRYFFRTSSSGKRVRARVSRARVRYFVAGEYGDLDRRPHFHALLFGLDFPDRVYWCKGEGGFDLDRSPILEKLWPHGFASVGDVTFQSAGYVARYVMKKITGQLAQRHYEVVDADGCITRLTPEFCRMSLKPGIGAGWFARWNKTDVDSQGMVVVNGEKAKAPRYYDQLLERSNPERFAAVQFARFLERPDVAERSAERLDVKRQVVEAKLSNLKRGLKRET